MRIYTINRTYTKKKMRKMVRLSKYKEFVIDQYNLLHEGFSLDYTITKTREFIKNNEGTLDGFAGKVFLSRTLMLQGQFKEFETVINSFESTGDDLVDYFKLDILSLYYSGLNEPTNDRIKSDEFHNKAQKLAEKMVFQDNWEEGIVTFEGFLRIALRTKDPPKRLELINKMKEVMETNQSIQGIKYRNLITLGNGYMSIGELDLAFDAYNKSREFFAKGEYSSIPISVMSRIFFLKNELAKSKELISIALEKSTQSTNYWLKSVPLIHETQILEHEQKIEDLEQNLLKHLKIAEEYGNNVKIFQRNYYLFNFYLNRYKNTENKMYIEKATKIKKVIEQMTSENPEDVTMQRFNDHANAQLFRLGTLIQKVKAVEIYEKLIQIFPNHAFFRLELIELYWDDLEYDINGEAKEKIDTLIEELKNLKYLYPNSLDTISVSFLILLAKYNFYINGKATEALESLLSLQAKAQTYGYKMIEEKLHKEIKILEGELRKNSDDYSIREKLNKIDIKSYIEGAKPLLEN